MLVTWKAFDLKTCRRRAVLTPKSPRLMTGTRDCSESLQSVQATLQNRVAARASEADPEAHPELSMGEMTAQYPSSVGSTNIRTANGEGSFTYLRASSPVNEPGNRRASSPVNEPGKRSTCKRGSLPARLDDNAVERTESNMSHLSRTMSCVI